MGAVGQACLIIALGLSVYGAVASLYGARTRSHAWVASGRRAVFALAAVAAVAFAVMEVAFLTSDFSFPVVAQHSSLTTPWYYQLAAPWSSQEGSLLLWLTMLAIWSAVSLRLLRGRLRDVAPYATAVLLGLSAFFAALLVFDASPFARVAAAPADGLGLNPLLRHPSMMIHPIMLYSGYTLFSVPFAFAVGALAVRRVDAEWLRVTRPFALGAWLALGIGIILGARWSYAELGWGGYWAWDPVENASLLPWITGTAFLHSVMIQERRGMLKVWNASLILATGILCVLGTFLVRSGILDSIHAFVQEGKLLAWSFIGLVCAMVALSVYLVTSRRRDALRSEARLDSMLSREAAFLANNLVLVAIAFVVFWGTFFPLISEALTGTKAAVGPPWFDRYTVPLVLILVLLSGIGPVIAWRRSSPSRLWRSVRLPVGFAALTLAATLALAPDAASHATTVVLVTVAAFAIAISVSELWRGMRARQAMTRERPLIALVSIVRRNRARYGGYMIHLGVAVLFIGIAVSSAFAGETDVRLAPGQSATVKGYEFTYLRPTARIDERGGQLERIAFGSRVRVERDGRTVAMLAPERNYFPMNNPMAGVVSRFFEGEATSEIGLRAGRMRDLWIAESPDIAALTPVIREGDKVFAAAADKVDASTRSVLLAQALTGLVDRYRQSAPPAQFRILVSPMVGWIWIGSLIVFAGGLVALWPAPGTVRGRVRARYAARVAQDLGRA
ncbi:MAG: heme lyase CcmF/NrfE family subunit [Solirubrobacteraceae bacterium]|nr:heme lyase CcmF/NrfE family subunit [Solirubrobacteraceae bacterium]